MRKRLPWFALAVSVMLLGPACGGGNGSGGELTGEIDISGSSTVEPISGANAEKFAALQPDVQISVEGPGTGDGFELFCEGDADISDASRPIDATEELPICEKNGIEFIELKVAIDGMAVLTSAEEEPAVECLSFIDLYSLLGPESEGFDKWSDANALNEEMGGDGDFPDQPLSITAPGEESGTYDSFAEIVLEDIAVEERKQPENGPFVRPNYQASPDDNVIIEGIANNPYSLGWVGYAFYVNAGDTVHAFPVSEEEGGDCIEPTDGTIATNEYPVSRNLYIYVNAKKAEQNEALSAYVDFYLSDEGFASVEEVGYVSLTDEAKQETISVWEKRETGSRDA